jgi:hypothetical protein
MIGVKLRAMRIGEVTEMQSAQLKEICECGLKLLVRGGEGEK